MRIITLTLLLLFTNYALACKCVPYELEEFFSKATEVLYVEIKTTEHIEAQDSINEKVKATYKIIESFKSLEGAPKTAFEGLHNCAPYMMAGRKFLLFINHNRYVSRCGGSIQLYDWTDQGKEKLEKLRKISTI